MKTTKWDIYEELKTEEDIQAFVEASIIEAENDAGPGLLAHALGVAAKAREMLTASGGAGADYSEICRSINKSRDPSISTFDRAARTLGYHLTLAPVQKG